MFAVGDFIGKFEIVSVRTNSVSYREIGGTKKWTSRTSQIHEWLELFGYYRKRCNGRPSVTDKRSSHTED